jgi:predicted Fe-Mo cluster-binding NifX family protein
MRMKVALPTMGRLGLDEEVAEHFGKAPYYTIVDTETMATEILANEFEHAGGHGRPTHEMVRKGVKVVICHGLGPRAVQVLRENGVDAYIGASGKVSGAISEWGRGRLQRAPAEGTCKGHGHDHSHN